MGEILKVLGQLTPTANILTDLYTVPANSSTVISCVTICNRNSGVTALFRIAIAKSGAADAPEQYIYYNLPLVANDTFIATIGIALATGDVVRIQSNVSGTSFNLLGVEVGIVLPPPSNTAGGDLSGFYPNPIVVGIQTNPVLYQPLTSIDDGYVLTWKGFDGYWEANPLPPPPIFDGPAGGDLFGFYPNPTVASIQDNLIYPQILGLGQDGYALTWDGVDGYWKALPSSTPDIDAVIFENSVVSSPENITSNRSFNQSPTTTPGSYQGIINLSSDTTGVTVGANGNFVTITGGDQNAIGTDYSFIGGGIQNVIATSASSLSWNCVISGGHVNFIDTLSQGASISGGYNNTINTSSGYTVIAGGQSNTIGASSGWVTISGGQGNSATGSFSFIGGGSTHVLGSPYGVISGGNANHIDSINSGTSSNSTISGGAANIIYFSCPNTVIAGGSNNTIGAGGTGATACVISGGEQNNIQFGGHCVIAGGSLHQNNANWSTISGGQSNTVNADYGFIGGGAGNTANNAYDVLVGGNGSTMTVGGGGNTIGGGSSNTAGSGAGSDTIAGGASNVASGGFSVVAGGRLNQANGSYSGVLGGLQNTSNALYSAVVGGNSNTNNGSWSTIINGLSCGISNNYAVVGGQSSAANGDHSFAFGNNTATSAESAVGFGYFTQSARFGQLSMSSSGSTITGSVGGDAQNGNVTLAGQASAVSTPFVLKDKGGGEFHLLNQVPSFNQYYSLQLNIILTANNAAVGPAYVNYLVMAHTAAGIAIIDNAQQINTTPDPYSTNWQLTVTVDGTTDILHITVNPNTDVTSIINACADIKWVEVAGFAQ